MSVVYKVTRNYTLQISAVILVVSVIALIVGTHMLAYVDAELDAQVTAPLTQGWDLMLTLIAALGVLTGGWYTGEQIYNRRKFERLIDTDKRSEFHGSRKKLEELARRLPETYKPRIEEKEATFRSKR